MDQTHSLLGISRTCRNEHTWGMATKKCTVVLACSSTYVFSLNNGAPPHRSSVSKVVKNQVSSQSMDQAGKGASTCYWFQIPWCLLMVKGSRLTLASTDWGLSWLNWES